MVSTTYLFCDLPCPHILLSRKLNKMRKLGDHPVLRSCVIYVEPTCKGAMQSQSKINFSQYVCVEPNKFKNMCSELSVKEEATCCCLPAKTLGLDVN